MLSMDATRRRGSSSLSSDGACEARDLYMLVPRFSICKVRSIAAAYVLPAIVSMSPSSPNPLLALQFKGRRNV